MFLLRKNLVKILKIINKIYKNLPIVLDNLTYTNFLSCKPNKNRYDSYKMKLVQKTL